jgi:hypothetical protein
MSQSEKYPIGKRGTRTLIIWKFEFRIFVTPWGQCGGVLINLFCLDLIDEVKVIFKKTRRWARIK